MSKLDPALLRQLSAIEDAFASHIAKESLATTDESIKKIKRSNWRLANDRANGFMQMALEIENGTN